MARTASLVLAAAAIAAGVAAIAFSWQPGLTTFHDDSASYLLMAQALSPWHAAGAPVLAQMPYEKYPPAFPLLLALTGAAWNWPWAHAIVALAFAASVWLLGILAARTSGSMAVGAAAGVVYAALPGVWLNMKGILSEFPYMALTFGTLAWWMARRDRTPGRGATATLALLLATVMLTRTIGFTLLAAIACAEAAAWRRTRDASRAKSVAASLAGAAAITAAWYVLRPAGGDDAYLSSSVGVLQRAREEGAGSIAALVGGNAAAIFTGWLNTLVIYWGEYAHPRFIGPAVLGAAALAASAWRAVRLEADGLYVLLFLAVLLAWPYPGQMYRLALPVFPLALALALCAAASLARARSPEPRASRVAAGLAIIPLAFCVPALFYIADRARLANASIMETYRIPFRPDAEAEAARQAAAFIDMRTVRNSTPEGARVMWYGPTYIALLAGRAGVPLDYPASAADFEAQIRRGRADYVYLSRIHPRDSARRLGDPLAPARYLRDLADTVWVRPGPTGAAESALFRVRTEGAR